MAQGPKPLLPMIAAIALAGGGFAIHEIPDDHNLWSSSVTAVEDTEPTIANYATDNAATDVASTSIGTAPSAMPDTTPAAVLNPVSKPKHVPANIPVNIPISPKAQLSGGNNFASPLSVAVDSMIAEDAPPITANLAAYSTFTQPTAYEVIKIEFQASALSLASQLPKTANDPAYKFDLVSGILTLSVSHKVGNVLITADSINIYKLSAVGSGLVTACVGMKVVDFGPCVGDELKKARSKVSISELGGE